MKIRGNAHQVLERYLALARDASSAGDRVTAENYYQHAEHYHRLLSAQAAANAGNPNGGNPGRPGFAGTGPQPELPAVADLPYEGDDLDDELSAGSGDQRSRSNGNGSQSPSA